MARRFEGAITTPADSGEIGDQSVLPRPERPPRPLLVEFAAAILIVGGLTALLTALSVPGALGLVFGVVNIAMIVLGVLIRRGQAWVVAINVVAIALFLELTALPSAFAILAIVLDAIVLVALFRHRAWFFWEPSEHETDGRTVPGEHGR